jgi:hypothetical protein
VLHGMRGRTKEQGGPIVVKRSELVLFERGREVRRIALDRPIAPEGTRVELDGARIDALEFRPLAIDGRFRGRPVAALAEIEVVGRIAPE